MNRREFSEVVSVALTGIALAPALSYAQAKKPVAGKHYITLDRRAPVDSSIDKIEVVFFFWYGCPHCYSFDPAVTSWASKLPVDVAFRRVHVAFRDDFVPQQRLFSCLEEMGLIEKLHSKVFDAIHTKRLPFRNGEQIASWVASQGVDRDQFLRHYNSFGLGPKLSRARQLQDAYAVEGVPAIGVAGRFSTDPSIAGGEIQSLQVTNYLISEVRAGR